MTMVIIMASANITSIMMTTMMTTIEDYSGFRELCPSVSMSANLGRIGTQRRAMSGILIGKGRIVIGVSWQRYS
jgi:hypothetical protein